MSNMFTQMTNYKVSLPERLEIKEFDLKMMISGMLFKTGKLSSGQAAKVVGISKRTFVEILGNYNIPVFDLSEEELLADIKNA